MASLGHDPTDRIKAMAMAQAYGRELHTGVFYRNPDPPPTYENLIRERHLAQKPMALPKGRILDLFLATGQLPEDTTSTLPGL